MDRGAADDDTLFEHAPPSGIQRRLGLVKPNGLNIRRRVLVFVLIAWLPIVLLVVLQSAMGRVDHVTSVLMEVDLHVRYLVAGPLLIVAEIVCVPQLHAIVHQFRCSGIVPEVELERFGDAIRSTRELLESRTAESGVVALAYIAVADAVLSRSLEQLPSWAASSGALPAYSPAGWWHILISLPLLLMLILGWVWRVLMWARLLWRLSRLDLLLVASHSDRCAGLGFLGHSVRGFSIVGLALAAVAAGGSAQMVITAGRLPTAHVYFNIGLMLAIAALFLSPVLAFVPTLIRVWRRGTFEYGALANRLGQRFERKWLRGDVEIGEEALEASDFSATADLYSVVSNVYAIRFFAIGLKDLFILGIALLLPFVPVVLLTVPIEAIWAQMRSLLF